MLSLLPDIDVLIEHKHSLMNGDSSNHSDLLCCIRFMLGLASEKPNGLRPIGNSMNEHEKSGFDHCNITQATTLAALDWWVSDKLPGCLQVTSMHGRIPCNYY